MKANYVVWNPSGSPPKFCAIARAHLRTGYNLNTLPSMSTAVEPALPDNIEVWPLCATQKQSRVELEWLLIAVGPYHSRPRTESWALHSSRH